MEAARPAQPDELARLAELAEQARAELLAQRGGAVLLEGACARSGPTDLGEWLSSLGRSLWAGTLDDAVVGVAAVSAAGRTGRFDLIYVEPDARGVGVGAALLGAGSEWLREQGCHGVDVAALPGSRAAKQFLESEGLAARLIVMHRELD